MLIRMKLRAHQFSNVTNLACRPRADIERIRMTSACASSEMRTAARKTSSLSGIITKSARKSSARKPVRRGKEKEVAVGEEGSVR
jgi:hypothetical protein